MSPDTIQMLIVMIVYIIAIIAVGIMYSKKANKSSDYYFLGGRTLGPWVTAMSAEASDMSGWLLMGLPGVAYWCGIADALWTAIGLAVGTYINWLLVSKRLRRYSIRANNSITIPDFFSNRFHEKKKIILTIASIFILVFFTVYVASCFATCGKLFSSLFGGDYVTMMILGAVFVFAYTILGGFLAESASDFIQGIMMFFALLIVVVVGVVIAGGFGNIIDNAKSMPGFFEMFGMASPSLDANGQQIVVDGVAQFGDKANYGFLTVLSTLAWGLGYFGVPQVLLRFMAIRSEKELKPSRIIATVWCVVSLLVAVFIGVMGRSLFPTEHLTSSAAENILITISTSFLPPIIAGVIMTGILSATISSSDSYLLIAASAVSKNLFKGIFKKDATDKQIMLVSRITLVVITLIALLIALDENSVIFKIVSFAWAGFGATFGPIMLFSLFWKRTTREGAIAGMLGGGCMVFIWEFLLTPIGGVFAIYELLPAFIFSAILIVVVSLLTKKPSAEIEADFDAVKNGTDLEPALAPSLEETAKNA